MINMTRKTVRIISALALMAMSIGAAASSQAAVSQDAPLTTDYALGAGIGMMKMSGDYIQSKSSPVVQLGWDGTGHGYFMIVQSAFATNNKFGAQTLVVGLGTSWLKIGSGFMDEHGNTPTLGGKDMSGGTGVTILTDSSRDTEIHNQTVPLYVRLTAWHDHNNLLNVDAWTSIYNRGYENIPVTLGHGLPAYYRSDYKTETRISGGSIRYTHRINRNVGWNLDVEYRQGVNKNGSFPSYYGSAVAAPRVSWHTMSVVLSAQVLF